MADALAVDKPPGSQRARVRKRKPDARLAHLHNLQTHVHRLHQEVESLKLTRQLLADRHALQRADRAGGSFERVVREYFDVFRFGMQVESAAAPVPSMVRVQRSTEQFLRAILDEHVNGDGPLPGIEAFIDLNKMYAVAFRENRLKLLNIEVLPGYGDEHGLVTVSGWGQYSCYITPTTIEMLFPHVRANAALVAKLLGQHISGVGRYDFVFDPASHRVVSTSVDLDFVSVFMAALQSPREVALLLDKAHISPDYIISASPTGSPSRAPAMDTASVAAPVSASSRIRMAALLT